jgi:uncharacterized phage protein (TIGR01671 family)
MNRQLKFRVWSKQKKKFIINDESLLGVALGVTVDSEYRDNLLDCPSDDLVFQQFTGLKDCQNKEIYEGDIVFVDEDFWMVVFKEGLFGLKFNEEDKVSPLYQYADCCVHGNIFENKGLICEN